jgi:hypothetical protein
MLADASKGKEKEPRVPVQGQWKITRAEVEGEEGVDPVIVMLYMFPRTRLAKSGRRSLRFQRDFRAYASPLPTDC